MALIRSFSKQRAFRKGVGVDFPGKPGTIPEQGVTRTTTRWISSDEEERNQILEEAWSLYEGRHLLIDGGPYRHVYDDQKVRDEGIDYLVANVLGHASDVFASLVLGKGFEINSEHDDINAVLEQVECLEQTLADALVRASSLGWCGLLPIVEEDDEGQPLAPRIQVILPQLLRPVWWPARDSLRGVQRFTLFEDPDSSMMQEEIVGVNELPEDVSRVDPEEQDVSPTELLLLDSFEPGLQTQRFFRVQGPWVVEELPLEVFTDLIDPTMTLPESPIQTGLPTPQMTILSNTRLGREMRSDYTPAAWNLQRQLNNRYTQEARILDIHSSPKLIMDRSAAKVDNETGKRFFDLHGKDLFFVNPDTGEFTPQYLTWDGQLQAAATQKLNILQALLTELKLSPHLLSFTDITGATSADTFSKLKLNLQVTLRRIERKRCFFEEAMREVLTNLFLLAGVEEAKASDFEMHFPDPVPTDRRDLVEELVQRRGSNMISSRSAIETLDGVTPEGAEEEYQRILDENEREVRRGPGAGLDSFLAGLGNDQDDQDDDEPPGGPDLLGEDDDEPDAN